MCLGIDIGFCCFGFGFFCGGHAFELCGFVGAVVLGFFLDDEELPMPFQVRVHANSVICDRKGEIEKISHKHISLFLALLCHCFLSCSRRCDYLLTLTRQTRIADSLQ